MGDLDPVAFDIETTGFEAESVITVVGLAFDVGSCIALNTEGESADAKSLTAEVEARSETTVKLTVCENEKELLTVLNEWTEEHVDGDRHYLTAFNGERWKAGFDLPFLRRACVRQNAEWPFSDLAYADVMTMLQRVDTGDVNDLVGVYDELIDGGHCDPFENSEAAVTAFENQDWVNLLLHNLADIQRTRELAVLSGRYVPKSDFNMKNLRPPDI